MSADIRSLTEVLRGDLKTVANKARALGVKVRTTMDNASQVIGEVERLDADVNAAVAELQGELGKITNGAP